MTKAVFFDWFNTLTTYYPPRENAYAVACSDLGLEVTMEQLSRGLLLADQFYSDENARSPIKKREPKEMIAVYVRYGQVALQGGRAAVERRDRAAGDGEGERRVLQPSLCPV